MSDKMKNFLVRTLSGIVMFAIVLGAILYSKWSFVALLTLITIGGEWEFYRFAQKAGYAPQRWIGLIMGVALTLFAGAIITFDLKWDNILLWGTGCLMPIMILCTTVLFVSELYRKSPSPIANIGSTLMGIVYVAIPMALLHAIPIVLGNGEWRPWTILFFIFIIWANDVFAYLFGVTMGKHRLFERISPKKSWEGFFGGLLGAMAMGYVAATILEDNNILWIGLALIAAISGVFGDLVESLFKRTVDIKDSGNFIPGHGGFLDRFDALIFATPIVFGYIILCKHFFEL